MVADKLIEPYPPFDYGAAVQWRRSSGVVLVGSVCGFRRIEGAVAAANIGFPEGTVLVLVEIESGESVEIPSVELEQI
ncbi:hypothetical protein LDO31_18645 [Luteimonas sp. XNQY3]|nr:hypothetical protein [Luteimonas sp. XNQY3]